MSNYFINLGEVHKTSTITIAFIQSPEVEVRAEMIIEED